MEILSQRRKETKIAPERHLFVFDKFCKSDNNIKCWGCNQASGCNARIHTKFGAVIKEVNTHPYNSSAAVIEVAKVDTALKHRAEDTVEKPSAVISEVLTNASQVTYGSLPDASAMRRTIERKRRALSAPPQSPLDLHELELPHQYNIYISGIPMKLLKWHQDYFQKFTLFLQRNFDGVIPVVYALLPKKQRLKCSKMPSQL
ncbi:Hypothetical predicted protein [Octopus vulgaris]|uniref:FLYWCH-type domain-containing protein n=1 Tax=Octopus vulgaris TaxID=6645 RepID=A0AA36ANK7_OCTVU|nr:Hypothetical predicted protein [Octopus vulgaris]